jgi:hypothetical protein
MFEMSVYRIYTNKCISIILSLNNIFPLELIQVIIRSYWNLHSQPVLLSLDVWCLINPVTDSRLKGYSALSKILEINPDLRYYPIYDSNSHELIDMEHIWSLVESNEPIPKAINSWISWISIIYLVPGPLWDYVMLYPDSETVNIDSIRGCNEVHEVHEGEIMPVLGKYKIIDPDDILRWFNDSLNHPDFLAVQNSSL